MPIYNKQNRLNFQIAIILNIVVLFNFASALAKADTDQILKHLINKEYEKALIEAEKTIEKDPDCSKCYFCRGYAFENLNKTFEALEAYDKAIELEPNNADYYHYRGSLRSLQYTTSQGWAIDDFTKCIELDPKNSLRYYRSRGNAYFLNGNHKKALIDFMKVVELGEKDSELLRNIGNCYFDLEKYKKAYDSLWEAVSLDKDNDLALLDLAKICSFQNKKEEALKYLELAFNVNGHVAKYGIVKHDYRWDNIRNNAKFQRLKGCDFRPLKGHYGRP